MRSTFWAASLFGSTAGPSATDWRRRQAAALVKLLALAPRRTLHREQVIDALWPEIPIEEAAPRLRIRPRTMPPLAGRCPGPVLDGNTVLFPDAEVIIDAEVFELGPRTRSLSKIPLTMTPTDSPRQQPQQNWTGDLLPDDPYEAWLEAPRDRLRQLHYEMLRRADRWSDLARVEPADEEASLAVARRLAESGDRRGALRQLERLERALRAGLGITPGPAAVSLRAELLALDSPHTRPRPRCAAVGSRYRVQPHRPPDHRGNGGSGADALGVRTCRASERPPCCGGSTSAPKSGDCA